MKSIRRLGCAILAAAVAWSATGQAALVAYQGPAARQAQREARSNPFGWLKKRASQIQSAAKRRAASQTAQGGQTPGRIGWTVHDIDAASALRRLERYGLKLPVDVQGRVTLRVRVGVPWRHVFTEKEYRLYAFISSNQLTVSGIELDRLRANLSYIEGVLRLEQLQLTTPDLAAPGTKLGVTGSATVQLEPRGDLTASLDFERLSLPRVLRQSSKAAGMISGEAAGHAEAKAPINRFRELAVWAAKGRINIQKLNAPGVREADLRADLQLDQGVASLSKLVISGKESPFSAVGNAKIQLQPRGDLTADLSFEHFNLAELLQAAPAAAGVAKGKIAGKLSVSAPLQRVGQVAAWTAKARLTSGDLQIRQLPAADLAADLRLANGEAVISELSVKSSESTATISGNARAQLDPPGNLTAELHAERIEIEKLLGQAPQLSDLATGQLSADLNASAAISSVQDPAAWQADATLSASDVRVAGLPPARIRTTLQVARGELTARQLDGDADFFRLEGSARLNLATPFTYSGSVRLTSSRLSRLNELKADWRLPVEIGGRLGASVSVQGAFEPQQFSARGGVAVRDLRVAGIAIDQLDFRYQSDLTQLQLQPLTAVVQGGSVSASVVVPLAADGVLRTGIRWRNVPVGRLVDQIAKLPTALNGRSTGTLQMKLPMNTGRNLAAWNAQGRVDVDQIDFDRLRGATAGADVSLAQGMLELRNLTAAAGSMQLQGSARSGVASPYDFEASLALSNADLALINMLPVGMRPTWALAGRAGVSAKLAGSLEPVKLQGRGALLVRQFHAGNVEVDSLSAKFKTDGRQFHLSQIDATLYQGSLRGDLTAPLDEAAGGAASLAWDGLQIGRLLGALQLSPGTTAGRSHGKIDVSTGAGKLRDVAQWRGDAEAVVEDVATFGWSLRQASARAHLDEGRLSLSALHIETLPAPRHPATVVNGSGGVKLAAPYEFDAKFDVSAFDLSRLKRLPANLRPPVEVSGTVNSSLKASGALDPLRVAAEGSVDAAHLLVAGAEIDSLALRFAVDDKAARLREFTAQLYEGRITGSAVVPLEDTVAGNAHVALQSLDVGNLLSDVGKLKIKVRGTADGKLDADIPPGRLKELADWTVHAAFDSPEIDVNSIRVGRVQGRFDYADSRLDYEAKGDLFSGTWLAAGSWQQAKANRPAVNEGQLQIQSVQLARLGAILRQQGQLSSLSGTFNARLDYHHDEQSGLPVGSGNFEVDALRFNGIMWSDRVFGVVRIAGDQIILEEVNGSIAGGRLRISGTLYASAGRRGRLRVTLNGVETGQLLATFIVPAPKLKGAADIDLLVFAGGSRPWQFTGMVVIQEAEFEGVPVHDVRAPLEGRFDPRSGNGELYVRDAAAQIAFGRLAASASITKLGGLQVDGHGKFTDLDLHHLLRGSSASSHFGTGKITGNFTLAGRDVRSVNDLTGTLKAKLRDTQAAALPLMQTMQSYVAGGFTSSSKFASGDLRARLSRGVFRVERLSLSSPSVQMYATGKVSLSGRLNLSVVVNTGQINDSPAILLIVSRLSVLVSPPVGLLLEANQFLSNQVVYLDITGTIHSPTIRVRPLPLLEEEAIRFFLLGAPIP